MRKKGNSRSIMVSEFLTEVCGRLKLDAQAIENYSNVPKEARVYLIPGKNQEGYCHFVLYIIYIQSSP